MTSRSSSIVVLSELRRKAWCRGADKTQAFDGACSSGVQQPFYHGRRAVFLESIVLGFFLAAVVPASKGLVRRSEFYFRQSLNAVLMGLALCLAVAFALPAVAQQIALPVEIIFIPKKITLGTLALETTVYKPPGPGPFPLVVINHGKAVGPPGLQPRYTPGWAARYFIERGYVVFVPMRTGFSKSTGGYVGGGCNIESNGLIQAEDVAVTVAYAHTLSYVERSQTLVVGQSHGGWTTLAYGATRPDPSVRGLVNFAGGLRQEQCLGWQSNLAKAAANYAQDTTLPSLWLYGDNDSFFSKEIYTDMFARYSKVNPRAHLVAFGEFGQDAHSLFGSKAGRAIWEPHLEAFMKKLGLPVQVVYPQYRPNP